MALTPSNSLPISATSETAPAFEAILSALPVGVIVQGPQAEIRFANPLACEVLGLDAGDLLGRTSYDSTWQVIHEDGTPFPGDVHPVPEAIRTRRPVHNVVMGVARGEHERVWLLVNADPQLNAAGCVTEVICTFTDISERRRMRLALAQRQAELAAAEEQFRRSSQEREHTLYLASIRCLAATVDARDAYTHSHSQQVAFYCRLMSQELALPAEQAETVALAGLLHDIGKIAIPDGILRKPARLTPDEWAIMRMHATRGAEILSAGDSAVLAPIVPMVRHHHERWGGAGYPDGLVGEAIPLGARIIAVADTFDTMTTARPYKRAVGLDEARAELQRVAGDQLEPVAVEALLAILARDEAAGERYLVAVQQGVEPESTSALRTAAALYTDVTQGPQSVGMLQHLRRTAHMEALYALNRGFDGAGSEPMLRQSAADLARRYLGAEAVYLLDWEVAPGETRETATRLCSRWGWHDDGPFEPFSFDIRDLADDQDVLLHGRYPVTNTNLLGLGSALVPLVQRHNWHSGIFIPLYAGEVSLGALGLAYHTGYRSFTPDDLELAEALGTSLARALAGLALRATEAGGYSAS